MRTVAFVVAAVAVLFIVSTQAGAQVTYNYLLIGTGSLLLNDPTYGGQLMGDLTGTWTIQIDDTGWPEVGDVDPTRFEHIWETFFAPNYDPSAGGEAWYGTFDGLTLPTTPQFVFDTAVPGGVLAGDISIRIMVRDGNANGVLDDVEKYDDQQYNGTLNVNATLATGAFVDKCGYGSLGGGTFNFVDPPGVDSAQFPGVVILDDCPPQPVEPSTWSTIKSLYQ